MYRQIITPGRILLYLVTANVLIYGCEGQSIIDTDRIIYSSVLNQEVNYSVLLPSDYEKSEDTRYPVIFLLHGINGNNNSWLQRNSINTLVDSLVRKGEIGDYIFIMPSAYNSYYINNYDSSFRYMDFFTDELVPAVDSIYRTIPTKENRALLGLSMGGFGSIMLGLIHPDLFGSVISLSAAVRTADIFKEVPQAKYNTYFGHVYGYDLSGKNRITRHWKENSPYFITDSIKISKARTLNWYIDCGLDDFLYPANEAFHQWLKENEIPHEYHVKPGGHNWLYWYRETISGLIFLEGKIND